MFKLVLVFTALTATACGSDGVSIDDFSTKYSDAYCANQAKCQGAKTVAECKASQSLNDTSFLTLLEAVQNGTVKYDEGTGADCIDSVRGASCNFEGLYEENACEDLFVGTVAQGGACAIDAECAGSAPCNPTNVNCDSDVMCCPGTCGTAQVVVASGGSCGENDTCADGTYCKPPATTGNGTCTALITTSGAACDSFFACANPMVCNLFAAAPTCETSAPSGGTCNPDQLIPCADGREHCDGATLKCVGPLADGAPCETSSECANYASCTGTCQADLGVGATCNDTTPDCAGSLDCTNGTCQLPPAGMSCL